MPATDHLADCDSEDRRGSLVVATSRGRRVCRALLHSLLFYVTALFVLVAVASSFSLVFLVPFLVDPALATLSADFDTAGSNCTTISGVYREGFYFKW